MKITSASFSVGFRPQLNKRFDTRGQIRQAIAANRMLDWLMGFIKFLKMTH
jgi:hypothetical protein